MGVAWAAYVGGAAVGGAGRGRAELAVAVFGGMRPRPARAANLRANQGRSHVGIGNIFGIVASVLVGGAVAAGRSSASSTSQTSTDGRSPVNVSQPVIDYGSGS